MAKNLFSIPIFFIVFRETLEAAIIISVLLGLAEQIVHEDGSNFSRETSTLVSEAESKGESDQNENLDDAVHRRRLIRKMRIQIFAGAALGLFIALSIGAAFIAVWFTKASNLWDKAEILWEGVFELIASLMIFVMGVSMLKMDRAKAKWRIKLTRAFDGKKVDGKSKAGKWVLFILPLVTVLREGMEAVVFVGGVSLGQPATAIPIAAIVGIICGLIIGFAIYSFASRSTLTVFLVVMTNLLLLIGAGLFSKAVAQFEMNSYAKLLGAKGDDALGTGPGSYRVQGNVWHLDCCSPNNKLGGQGWSIFGAIFGWSNNGSVGTILAYVFYWIAVIATLVYLKFNEGRMKLFGKESAVAIRRQNLRREKSASQEVETSLNEKAVDTVEVLPRA